MFLKNLIHLANANLILPIRIKFKKRIQMTFVPPPNKISQILPT